ncbi:MAG TPA: tetratricopeptide repeat protein, partial [Pyrinomonadaceae bacterium]
LFRVGLPWKDWAFDIRLSEFGVPVEKPDPTRENLLAVVLSMSYGPLEYFADDGREYRLRVFRRSQKNERSGTSLSVEMKPVTPVVGAAEFRAAELKRLERSTDWSSSVRFIVRRGSVKTWEYNDVPVARYATAYEHDSAVYQGGTDTRVGGSTQHLAAFYVKDGVGVTVTLSAASLKEPEEALFRSLLDSVRPVDTSTPSSSFDHYHKGRLLFLQKDYCAAAAALGQALTLERLQRQLDPKSWRDLVSKLTDAHAANGDRARAKEVLDYALAQEPDNPLFHMALARYHATLGETDSALAALGKAFGYMKRENPRAPLPDLKFDAVFNRYMKDEKFVKAVKALRK